MKQLTLSESAISELCRSLSLQLHAGIPIADGLYLLAQEQTGPSQALTRQLAETVDYGTPLHTAMEQSGAFPRHAIGLIEVGARAGRLEEALDALSAFYQHRVALRWQLRSAVAYPLMLLCLMLAVIGVLLVRVLPVFDEVYAALGTGLTGLAAGLLHVGQLLKAALPVLFVLLCVILLAAALLVFSSRLRSRVTRFLNARFGDRGVSRQFNNAHFAQAMAMALRSGFSAEEAVSLGAGLLEDTPATARIGECQRLLAEGVDLNEALTAAQLLRPKDGRLLALGIRGGSADRVMDDIAAELSEEADRALDRLISRVEPSLVLTGCCLVGLILLCVMLPLFDIMSLIG